MALLKKKAGRMCDFCHKAWKGKDYLVYLRHDSAKKPTRKKRYSLPII